MGKNYYFVGGSTGIARSMVEQLSAQGHTITVASRKEEGVGELDGVTHIELDILNHEGDLPGLSDELHGLVYAPGSIQLKPFKRITDDEFRADWEINFLGATRAIRGAIRPLRKAKGASVLLFSTVAVQRGLGFHASIAAAKGAVEGLTLAGDLLANDQKRENADKRPPLGRFGQPQDVAQAGLFLLSDHANWMTGQIIGVDGGLSVI